MSVSWARLTGPDDQQRLEGFYHEEVTYVDHALGMHTFSSKPHGGKLRPKSEIRIASVFRTAPEAFLRMIVVHELAHLREKDHSKAFYRIDSKD